MRIRVSGSGLGALRADLAVSFAFEGDRSPRGVEAGELRARLAREMKTAGFLGKAGEHVWWSPDGGLPARRFLVLGLGPQGNGVALRLGAARAVRAAQEVSARTLAIRLPGEGGVAESARQAAEGVALGAYRFDRYIHDPSRRPKPLATLELAVPGSLAAARRAVAVAGSSARAVCLARDLVNEGPSRCSPPLLARRVVRVARSAGLRCRVHGVAELRRIGLGALLAVARGSSESPRVVHLVYRPPARLARRRAGARILLVGKGVTFDSGGLNLKPGDSMLTMKADMAGAAAVLATMTALGEIGCPVEVHGLLGLVENMTGPAAYKPGDILDTWAGKSVEVGNTDAEGRLVLCDLLAWGAATVRPTTIVDLATLTGACVVALGTRAAGLFARADPLRDALLDAARAAGEKLWSMPLYDDYLALIQKGPADLRNVGGRYGGAIIAALFLGEFVPRDVPWAHIDIAGPAFTEEDLPDAAAGGTGAGVLTLLRWLERV